MRRVFDVYMAKPQLKPPRVVVRLFARLLDLHEAAVPFRDGWANSESLPLCWD
jgi:hypothetical protein